MSDWTEGRTWTRVVRRDTRDESGWITVEQAAPAYTNAAFRLVRARGGV